MYIYIDLHPDGYGLGFHLTLAASWTPTSPAPCLLDSRLLAVSSVDSLPAFGSQVSAEGG